MKKGWSQGGRWERKITSFNKCADSLLLKAIGAEIVNLFNIQFSQSSIWFSRLSLSATLFGLAEFL